MNFVILMTDTQNKAMVGAYGNRAVNTPSLDRLADMGIRFERAYTTCPVCTPARGAVFSGMHPQINGACMNNVSPHRHVALMGEVFRHYGYRAAYTGKWHLDGSGYYGDGMPGGGFEPDWWYDGKRYAQDIGREMFEAYKSPGDAASLRRSGFTEANMWGHRVADRAVDFLEQVNDDSFVLVCSFDEPHGPWVAPPEYWEGFDPACVGRRPNFDAPLEGKPELQKVQALGNRTAAGTMDWADRAERCRKWYGCNSYIDREIGRVIDAVESLHGSNTVILYTSDHGDMNGSHGLRGKGPEMYEEITSIPFIVKMPEGPRGAVCESLVSHLDIMPTMLDLAGIDIPESIQGVSFGPILADPNAQVRDMALISWHRFAINHDSRGGFYPIRCVTDGRYKLAINLFDTDELYDLASDPYEMTNRIDDASLAEIRDALHARLLDEMDRIRDPLRSFRWGSRAWRSVRECTFRGENRLPPKGFPFQGETPDWP